MQQFNNNPITIYIFGNPLVKEDSLPLKILPKLKKEFPKIEFKVVDPNENFPPEEEKDLIILDTVAGLKKPKIFGLKDIERIHFSPVSPHDYDLGMHLLLLKKLKKINTVTILGIPSSLELTKLRDHVILSMIKKIISSPFNL